MSFQQAQTFLLQDQQQSMKSSKIKIEGRLTCQNTHAKSLCHEEIISENCEDESFENDELYNEESSLPLCMKEYYINEKEVKCPSSQRPHQFHQCNTQQSFLAKQLPAQNQKVKLMGFQKPEPLAQVQHEYHNETVEQRNQILSVQLQNQRIKNLHFQKMLSILIEQDQIQRSKFQSISNQYLTRIQLLKQLQIQNRSIKLKHDQLQKQITHYKDLIYLANSNYQHLQSKLQQAHNRISMLQNQRQQRQKLNHQKLDNLKQVMKSLMLNLNHNPTQYNTHQPMKFRIDSKDNLAPENCYSFGDHDTTLRERKDKNKTQAKLQSFNSLGNNTKHKPIPSTNDKSNHPKIPIKKTFEKQNLFLSQRIDDSFQNKNFSSNKTTTINKLKSPKNLTVEQNYRKLFMKTLISSSQKPKIEHN